MEVLARVHEGHGGILLVGDSVSRSIEIMETVLILAAQEPLPEMAAGSAQWRRALSRGVPVLIMTFAA